MALVTISILEGLERGRTFRDLETPVTIGREEDNVIQLNDERVSRIHAKLQEDRGQVILTDLNSTNGSRVNGHPVQLRVLQPGDHVQIGRCTLLFGSDAQIAEHAQQLGLEVASLTPLSHLAESGAGSGSDSGIEFELADEFNAKQRFNLAWPFLMDVVDIFTTVFVHFGLTYSVLFAYTGTRVSALLIRSLGCLGGQCVLQVGKELIRHLFGKAVDDPTAKLRQLAAHLCIHIIG